MSKNSLGCGKKFKYWNGATKKTDKDDYSFICGVADGWGKEHLCNKCKEKLKKKWVF